MSPCRSGAATTACRPCRAATAGRARDGRRRSAAGPGTRRRRCPPPARRRRAGRDRRATPAPRRTGRARWRRARPARARTSSTVTVSVKASEACSSVRARSTERCSCSSSWSRRARSTCASYRTSREPQLRRAGVGEVAQGGQLVVGPLPRPDVDGTERPEDVAGLVGERHPGIGDDAEVVDGAVVAQQRVLAGVGDDQRLGRGDDVLAERVGQRGRPGRGPGLGQPGHAGEDLPVRLHERDQRDGRTDPAAHPLGQGLHLRVGDLP